MSLGKRAKEVIMTQITEQMEKQDGIISEKEVMDLIEPHYFFNSDKAREQEIRRKANSLIAQFKKEKGKA